MYTPTHYEVHDDQVTFEMIRQNPFATIVSGDGSMVSHLPLVLEITDGVPVLMGHCARANPHWRNLSNGPKPICIFHGPHSYISPAWYTPDLENVPTWNYAATHVTGNFQVQNDRAIAWEMMKEMVTTFESKYKTGWRLPVDDSAALGMLSAIVVFKITNLTWKTKFKLSQNQPAENRDNVIKNLLASKDPDIIATGQMMEQTKNKAQFNSGTK
jgi:transcriptional regulator